MFVCYVCFVFIVSPLSYCLVVSTTAADAPVIDYVVDDRTPLPSSFQASSAPSALPHITYLSLLFCCTRHCCCYVTILFNYIAYHCRPLITFPISYDAYTYIIYTAVNPAL